MFLRFNKSTFVESNLQWAQNPSLKGAILYCSQCQWIQSSVRKASFQERGVPFPSFSGSKHFACCLCILDTSRFRCPECLALRKLQFRAEKRQKKNIIVELSQTHPEISIMISLRLTIVQVNSWCFPVSTLLFRMASRSARLPPAQTFL